METIRDVAEVAASEPLPGLPQKRRIWRGSVALTAYAAHYPGADSEDIDTLVADLIADLGHLVDAAGGSFSYAVSVAVTNLEAEREENE